jgi:hypothetical protein
MECWDFRLWTSDDKNKGTAEALRAQRKPNEDIIKPAKITGIRLMRG